MSLWGHAITVARRLARATRPPAEPPWEPWSTTLADQQVGPVRLTGRLTRAGAERLLIVVHGLGGCATSGYAVLLARRAAAAGWTTLRLNLRGADRLGEDFHHAALTADLGAALADPTLAAYRRVAIAGFSLGGHLALHWATAPGDPRVCAVAAVCPPLALAPCADHIDRPSNWLYRSYVLRHLKEIYAAVAARRPVPVPPAAAARIRRLRDWDEATVAPRFGFAGAADYYERASVGPSLDRLRVPSLLLAGTDDPMVPLATVESFLSRADSLLLARRAPGGHVAFPRNLDVGLGGGPGLEGQLLAWLDPLARPRGGAG